MNAKEKAIEIYGMMNVIHYTKLGKENKDSKGLPVSMYDDQIKQCAINAVDLILEATKESEFPMGGAGNGDIYDSYWLEVKKEVEKL